MASDRFGEERALEAHEEHPGRNLKIMRGGGFLHELGSAPVPKISLIADK